MYPICYWSGATENTHRFIKSLHSEVFRIQNHGRPLIMQRPYILAFPTYGDGNGNGIIPKPVIRFLGESANARNLAGVIGAGNRNFGPLFAQGATIISIRYTVPVIAKIELAGMPGEAEFVLEGMADLWSKTL